jgi:hypothetical protein
VPILAVALLLGACADDGEAPPSSGPATSASPSTERPSSSDVVTPTTPAPPPTASPAVSPSATPEPVVLPPGVPRTYGRDVEPGDLPFDELVPGDADVGETAFPSELTAIVTWSVGDDPFGSEHGVVVWRRSPGSTPPWRATYALREPARAGVLGIRIETGDATGDLEDDALLFESVGGSGACGTWRLLALEPAGDVSTFDRDLCDASVEIASEPAGLRLTEAVFGPGDPHCCPSGTRTSTLEWNGRRWRVTSIDRSEEG